MGREVRRVPPIWRHPSDGRWNDGSIKYEPLKKRSYFDEGDNPDEYMPDWNESEATHYAIYETVTEGTPLTPAFATPEELAQWCVDNKVSAFAGQAASYESWLRVANGGYAPTAIMRGGIFQSGVSGLTES
jgi:hypothetical protein